MSFEVAITEAIESELAPHGFQRRDLKHPVEGLDVVVVLARRTWNTNRAAVVLRAPTGEPVGPLGQRHKIQLGKAIGYFPLFWGLGLQLIWVGEGIDDKDLDQHVDKYDNQRCILQSIFVADSSAKVGCSARTWGQLVTGKFQDAIARGITAGYALRQ